MKRFLFLSLTSLLLSAGVYAQDDLLSDLVKEDSAKVKENITIATFKATRIINMQSVEMTGEGNLQFMIIHHFGALWDSKEGAANFARLFGMNGSYASTYLSFDYTPVRWMNLGIAWAGSTTMEGNAKFKLLRQQTGKKNIPVSVVWASTANFNASKQLETPQELYWNRFSYLNQILIARKFTDKLSLQLIPSMIHKNIISYGYSSNHNIYSIGIGGRYKISEKRAITFEYSRQLNMYENVIDKTGAMVSYSPDLVSFGYDWDTGGHIFQFFFTNSAFASNIPQLTQNPTKDNFGQWSLGFNLNRSYTVKHKVPTH